jgi:hypothetical protein
MNHHGGDLTPSVTPAITPVAHATEKSKESITVVPPTQEYLDMFSTDISVIKRIISVHTEIDEEFIVNFNKDVEACADLPKPNHAIIALNNKLPMEKTFILAEYLNIYYEDDDIERILRKKRTKLTDEMYLSSWVGATYDTYDAIKYDRI